MILSDIDIKQALSKGELIIKDESSNDLYIGPSSIDLHLDSAAKILDEESGEFEVVQGKEFTIDPGDFWLMSTTERIFFPNDICGFVQGRSSVGRLGIQVHCAGFIDVGFRGSITLEVTNLTKIPVVIKSNMRICQIVFMRTQSPAEIGYGDRKDSKYQNQNGAKVSEIEKDI